MEEVAVLAGVEVVKLLINLALQQSAKAQMTQEQLDNLLKEERAKFLANDPNLIPDAQSESVTSA